MKKKLLILISFLSSITALAEDRLLSNFYAEGFGGLNFAKNLKGKDIELEIHSGYAVGTALGYRFSKFFRLEGEIAYRENRFYQLIIKDLHVFDLKNLNIPASGKMRKTTLFANGLIDIPLIENSFIPYFGIGLGRHWDKDNLILEPIPNRELSNFEAKFKGNAFAFQGIIGLTFCIFKKMQIAMEYRYLDGLDMERNQTLDFNLRTYF